MFGYGSVLNAPNEPPAPPAPLVPGRPSPFASGLVFVLEEEVAERVFELVRGYLDEIVVGDPARFATDVGPVIDEDARAVLAKHAERMTKEAKLLKRLALPASLSEGTFFPPHVFAIESMGVPLPGETALIVVPIDPVVSIMSTKSSLGGSAGVVAWIVVALCTTTPVAATPPIVTVAPSTKSVPLIVIALAPPVLP